MFTTIEEAKAARGVRLVVTRGIPVPWSEAAKGILYLKKIPYLCVAHEPARPNPEILAWTGFHNAPILIVDDEPAQDRWANILVRLEQLAPAPRLIPADETDRMLMFGYIHELLEADGYIWNRRLWLNAQPESVNATLSKEALETLRSKYGQSKADRPEMRIKEVLIQVGRRLQDQKARGSRYFIGDQLTALDIYWATTCALVKPLPEALCPMEPGMRFNYTERLPSILSAVDPILYEHRDFIYQTHLQLPLQLDAAM